MRHGSGDGKESAWKGWLWMALCCIPMFAIIVLIALGYWSLPW